MKTGDSSNLNLLPSQAKFQAAKMKLRATLRHYMAIAIVLWIAVMILVGALFFGSGFVLSLQSKKYDQSLASYRGLSQEIILNQLLKYRSKVLGQVLDDRFEYSAAFEKINSIFSEKAKVSGFELNKNKEFVVNVLAADKNGVDFVENKVAEANDGVMEGVQKITIKNVSYVVNGGWAINMEVVLK